MKVIIRNLIVFIGCEISIRFTLYLNSFTSYKFDYLLDKVRETQ